MKRIILDGKESNYTIDENGKVYNIITNKELKGSITVNGYKYFRLSDNGKKYRFYAHRLVAEYFLDNNAKNDVVNHINGDKLDNRVSNLEWISYSENNIHANKTGLRTSNTKKKVYFDKEKDNLPNELWKEVKDFPEYLVSNYGRVRSLKNNHDLLLKGSLTNGYYKVVFSVKGKTYDKLISYLVYFTFNPNEELDTNKVIDHIDGNKTNNNLENLRYISKAENTQAAYYSQKTQSNIRSVICYKYGQQIGIYPSCKEASRQLNLDASSISKCCRGIYKHTHNYTFKYL